MPNTPPITITLSFDTLFCFQGADQGSDFAGDSSEPYLWAIMVAFDGSTITQSGTNFVGTPRYFLSPGSHGNLDLGSGIVSGETVGIPAAVGSWTTTVTPIVITDTTGATLALPAQVVMIGVLMEQNDTPNEAVEAGHAALNTYIQTQLNTFVGGIDLVSVNSQVQKAMQGSTGLSETAAISSVFMKLLQPVKDSIMANAVGIVTDAIKSELDILGLLGSFVHRDEPDGQCFQVIDGTALAASTIDTPLPFVHFVTGDKSTSPAWGYNLHGRAYQRVRNTYTPMPDSVPPGRLQITCVDRVPVSGQPKVTWLSHIGGVLDDGTPWRLSRANAVGLINSRANSFFVQGADGSSAAVEVVSNDPLVRSVYLRTHPDGSKEDNLGSLPTPCLAFITHTKAV